MIIGEPFGPFVRRGGQSCWIYDTATEELNIHRQLKSTAARQRSPVQVKITKHLIDIGNKVTKQLLIAEVKK